jgi:hypothetical protein
MRPRQLALVVAVAVTGWLVPGVAHGDLRLAILSVKGMVCQA